MREIELVIFDLDGTLVDTEKDVFICLNLSLEKLNLPLISLETAKKAIGPGPAEFLRYVLGEENLHRGQEFRDVFRPIYAERCADHAELFKGIIQLLEDLQSIGIRCAVATNKAQTGTFPILKSLGIEHYFDFVMTRDQVENPKPAPDMLVQVCNKLEVEPSRALMLGDTDNDIYAAKAAEIKSCLALWGYSEKMDELEREADFVAKAPGQLLQIIDKEIVENV